jgi:hypothetical protein
MRVNRVQERIQVPQKYSLLGYHAKYLYRSPTKENGNKLSFECYFQHTLFDHLDSQTPEAAGGALI